MYKVKYFKTMKKKKVENLWKGGKKEQTKQKKMQRL